METKDRTLTISFDHDSGTMEINDQEASPIITEVELTPENLMKALDRLGPTPWDDIIDGYKKR